MRRLKFLLIAFGSSVVVVLIALAIWQWKFAVVPADQSVVESSSSSAAGTTSSSSTLQYADFTPDVLHAGVPLVLFFASKNDPFSAAHDADLRALAASGAIRIPTYRVDYDTATGARFNFAVVIPDTFVLVNAQRERTASLIHPTSQELREFLLHP